MPCLQANSINWTPFYSMASKIDTSGSCPIGLCKSLLRRIAQVVGLALDALTLPIRLPISCLCPGSLKGKVKNLSNEEKKEASDEKKEVEKKEADLEVKGDPTVVQPLEENKSEPSASSSSRLGQAVDFLLERNKQLEIFAQRQEKVAHLMTLAVEELLHTVQTAVRVDHSTPEKQELSVKKIEESLAKAALLVTETKNFQGLEQPSLEGEDYVPEDDLQLSGDEHDGSAVEDKKEISSEQKESAGESSAPVNEEKKEEPAALPPVPNGQVDPSLNAAPSNVPAADIVPPPASEVKKEAELPSLDKPEDLHPTPLLSVTHPKEELSSDGSETKKEEDKSIHLGRKLSNAALKVEGFVGEEVNKLEGAFHAIGHKFSKKHKEKGSDASGSHLSERSSSKEERSSGTEKKDLLTPPTSPKSTDPTKEEGGYELIELPVPPPTPSPTKVESKAKEKAESSPPPSAKQALSFNQPLKVETTTKEGKLNRAQRKALEEAEKEAAIAAKKAEKVAQKEAKALAEKAEQEAVDELKNVG